MEKKIKSNKKNLFNEYEDSRFNGYRTIYACPIGSTCLKRTCMKSFRRDGVDGLQLQQCTNILIYIVKIENFKKFLNFIGRNIIDFIVKHARKRQLIQVDFISIIIRHEIHNF